MRSHCDRHLGGFLEGDLPLYWLDGVRCGVREVCSRILSTRFRGRCPSCWPAFVASQPQPTSGRPLSENVPPLRQIFGTQIRPRSLKVSQPGPRRGHRPQGHPSLVLPCTKRGGTSRTGRSTNETRRRCRDCLELWDPSSPPTSYNTGLLQGPSFPRESIHELDDRTAARVHTLIKEEPLRQACTALTSERPVVLTQEDVEELRRLHPGPSAADQNAVDELGVVGPGAVPVVDPDIVHKALGRFTPT